MVEAASERREAFELDRRAGERFADDLGPEPGPPARAIAAIGVRAGLAAGAAMMAVLMVFGEIANDPTPVAGVDSSTWTAPTSITAFAFGHDAFSGSFDAPPILLGLAWHALNSAVAGVVGAAGLVYALGARPGAISAMILGVAYGLALEVFVLNFTVNALDDPNLVYESVPPWCWWVAHVTYGALLGLVASRRLARRR